MFVPSTGGQRDCLPFDELFETLDAALSSGAALFETTEGNFRVILGSMGIEGISKPEVSRMAAELDSKVTEVEKRPLHQGPYRYLWIDVVTQGQRGRADVSAVIAVGRREIVGFDIVTTEDTAAWTAFLRSLAARGMAGVELVISDAHGGIKAAIAAVFAEASWQRC